MKLLIITEGYYPYTGGLEKIVTEIAQGLNEKNTYEVTVLTSIRENREPFQEEVNGVKVYYVPLSISHGKIAFAKELFYVRKFMKNILDNRFDVISIQYIGYFASMFFTIKSKIPYIISIHGNDITGNRGTVSKFIQKKIINRSDGVISNSYYLANELENKLSISIQDKIHVIWNGLHLEKYKAVERLTDEMVVVSVGRFVYKKGFDILIKAFAAVVKRFPEAKLLMAGDGIEKWKCVKLSEKLGISENIIFLGQVLNSNISDVLSRGRVFVCPSRNEPFGIVVLEAMAMGIPVIATDSGGVREIIENDKYGYIVPIEDSGAMAEKIIEFLENRDKCNDFSNRGLNRVKDFSIVNVIEQYDTIIKKIYSSRRYVNEYE